ncbi:MULTISPECIES: OpgC domain-containing protein [Bradyrhizobium]|uniref:OpgC domain-containing protein n=1 Tax=Bradyrhizobium septentrionale TaxID=1404411 RepID=A0ABZ2P0T4_9BRAD|nr:OpgC domain-containing protein [Bradyrhizobium sp. 2S1]
MQGPFQNLLYERHRRAGARATSRCGDERLEQGSSHECDPVAYLDGDRRDLRLDACRGLALWFIFIDHIPGNGFDWLTIRNYGLSDTSERFLSSSLAILACLPTAAHCVGRDGQPSSSAACGEAWKSGLHFCCW